MIPCDRCGGRTKPKEITSKKQETYGQKYTVMECLSGCKNGKFNYSFFPPKEEKQVVAQPKPNGNGSAIKHLQSIDTTLKNILSILQAKNGQIPVQPEELQPDDEVPF